MRKWEAENEKMHTKYLMYKLQKALKQTGIILSINTTQFYSEQQDRMIDYYIIKQNKKQIYASSSQIKIVKFLAEMLEERRNNND